MRFICITALFASATAAAALPSAAAPQSVNITLQYAAINALQTSLAPHLANIDSTLSLLTPASSADQRLSAQNSISSDLNAAITAVNVAVDAVRPTSSLSILDLEGKSERDGETGAAAALERRQQDPVAGAAALLNALLNLANELDDALSTVIAEFEEGPLMPLIIKLFSVFDLLALVIFPGGLL